MQNIAAMEFMMPQTCVKEFCLKSTGWSKGLGFLEWFFPLCADCVCVHTQNAVEWDEGSFVLQVRQEQGESSIQSLFDLDHECPHRAGKTLAVTTHPCLPQPRLVLSQMQVSTLS